MQQKFQRIGLVAVVIAAALYVGYRAWKAGGLEQLIASPSASPIVSSVPSPTLIVTSPYAPPAPPAPTVRPTGPAAAVLFSINERRAGSVVLQSNAILMREAQEHASDMARRSYFDHTDPDGVTFSQRMAVSGYPATAIAENLGLTSGADATAVVPLWMDSPGHRENMLNPAYVAAGIGVATGMWQGQEALFVVAIFGGAR